MADYTCEVNTNKKYPNMKVVCDFGTNSIFGYYFNVQINGVSLYYLRQYIPLENGLTFLNYMQVGMQVVNKVEKTWFDFDAFMEQLKIWNVGEIFLNPKFWLNLPTAENILYHNDQYFMRI